MPSSSTTKAPYRPSVFSELTRLLLDSNTNRMPPAFEHGLTEFFSTFEVNGIHITSARRPPQPDLDWARVHLLVVAPEYFGKLRTLLYNLRKGVDDDAAYQNAFGKSPAEVEALAKSHFAAGNFQTTTISSLPMAPSDFHEKPISDTDMRLARADLLAGEQSAAEYRSLLNDHLKVAESEGGPRPAGPARHIKTTKRAAISPSPSRLVPPAPAATSSTPAWNATTKRPTKALLQAAGINPKLDEPFAMMAQRDTDPQKRLAHWKAAAERDPRNASYWQALAECYLERSQFHRGRQGMARRRAGGHRPCPARADVTPRA